MLTDLGFRHKAKQWEIQSDHYRSSIDWIGPLGQAPDAERDKDYFEIEHNQLAVTPLPVDLTRHENVYSLQRWLGNLT